MRLILIGAAVLATFGSPASAGTISFTAPAVASGSFDVIVKAQNLFASRDPATDGIISYGFSVGINPLQVTFNGANSGPLFDPPTTEPGTDVFGAASGFGIFEPVTEPLILAILHFTRTGAGAINITIGSNLSNAFQGLQYLNMPYAESIAGTVTVGAVPEPATFGFAATGLAVLGVLRRKRRLAVAA